MRSRAEGRPGHIRPPQVAVVIRSGHGDITTGKQAKHGFADINHVAHCGTAPRSEPGSLYPVLAALPQMVARRQGHIVIVSSLDGRRALPGDGAWATKPR